MSKMISFFTLNSQIITFQQVVFEKELVKNLHNYSLGMLFSAFLCLQFLFERVQMVWDLFRLVYYSVFGFLLRASINNVDNWGEGGIQPNDHFTLETLLSRTIQCPRRGRGYKIPRKLSTWFMDGPMLLFLARKRVLWLLRQNQQNIVCLAFQIY